MRSTTGAYTGISRPLKFLKTKRFTGFSTETAATYYHYYFQIL